MFCTSASGSTFPIGHTTVTCTATDKHGNTSAPASFDVYVKGATAQIGDQIALVGSTGGGSFASQLENALAQLAGGSKTAACGSLGAYINHLQAQSGKQFSVSQAARLITNANRIRVTDRLLTGAPQGGPGTESVLPLEQRIPRCCFCLSDIQSSTGRQWSHARSQTLVSSSPS
jgi:hypothetical protein